MNIKLPKNEWSSLKYWSCGEWQVVEERLEDEKGLWCPAPHLLFDSLHRVPPGEVRCMVLGQDPYPSLSGRSGRQFARGVAFSISADEAEYPPTLKNIFKEYEDDLHYPAPKNGDLTSWCNQGVLLWNAYPSCALGRPGSHHWEEWTWLTREILNVLNTKDGMVFILLGSIARSYAGQLTTCDRFSGGTGPDVKVVQHNLEGPRNRILETSHPSPLGANKGFLGSRIFSRANQALSEMGQEQIDWRLPDGPIKKEAAK